MRRKQSSVKLRHGYGKKHECDWSPNVCNRCNSLYKQVNMEYKILKKEHINLDANNGNHIPGKCYQDFVHSDWNLVYIFLFVL